MNYLRSLYLKAILNFLPLVAVVVILVLNLTKWGIFVLVFGGLIALGRVIVAVDILKCIHMLQTMGLAELADSEEPVPEHKGYAITRTFLWGFDRNLCIPLSEIEAVKPVLVRCVNNFSKNRATLRVYTKKGPAFYVLHHGGLASERDYDDVSYCVRDLSRILPELKLKR